MQYFGKLLVKILNFEEILSQDEKSDNDCYCLCYSIKQMKISSTQTEDSRIVE